MASLTRLIGAMDHFEQTYAQRVGDAEGALACSQAIADFCRGRAGRPEAPALARWLSDPARLHSLFGAASARAGEGAGWAEHYRAAAAALERVEARIAADRRRRACAVPGAGPAAWRAR